MGPADRRENRQTAARSRLVLTHSPLRRGCALRVRSGSHTEIRHPLTGHSPYNVVDSADRVELWQPRCFGVEQYKSPGLEFVFGHDSARMAQLSPNSGR